MCYGDGEEERLSTGENDEGFKWKMDLEQALEGQMELGRHVLGLKDSATSPKGPLPGGKMEPRKTKSSRS